MSKGGKKTTTSTSTGLDTQSQAYVDAMRKYGLQAGELINKEGSYFTGPQTMSIEDQVTPFMNPYIQNVINSTRGEFDHLRGLAAKDASSGATMAGAWGGSRHGVAEGVRLGELDRAQGSTVAGLLQSGYQDAANRAIPYWEQQRQLKEQQLQEPFWRQQMGLGSMNMGMGPTGWNTNQTSRESGGSVLGNVAGLLGTYMGAGGKLPGFMTGGKQPSGGINWPGGWPGQGQGIPTIPGDPTFGQGGTNAYGSRWG